MDKLHGRATEHHPDGTRFNGGKKHGKGKLLRNNRASY
jgi:hypothetical protein